MAVQTGLMRVMRGEIAVLAGRRLALIANPTSVDERLRHAVDLFHEHPDLDLRVLLGPEHGLRGAAQDMISVDQATDSRTGVPVYSLYGADEASLTPPADALSDVDAIVFDIQDVGARYYTYVWTMVLAMRACAKAGVAVVVLDRPNPIGGALIEGGAVADDYRSFVGLCSVPNRHGMTAGEIARWARARESIDVELHVVAMAGWKRSMRYPDTGLPWVMPSPNMPTVDTALVYPGLCLLEGTELSEGRGTTRPFEISGAPFVDGYAVAELLEAEDLPGVELRPMTFEPTFHKCAGHSCGGVQLHVTDAYAFRPYLTGVALLWAIHRLWPDQFAWRTRAYEFVTDKPAIDLLAGDDRLRLAIDAGASLADLAGTWREAESEFGLGRPEWFLY